jgi:serine/threonine protein kinase
VTVDPEVEVIDGRYALAGVIGRGAMAEVRAGEDRRLGRRVAVKLLHESLAVQPEARVRFEEEARAAARLSDPNVVAIYDTGEHRQRPFIVMELLPGRTFHDELREGPLSEGRARAVTLDVLRALRAAHAAGVVHRDIKPANILLTETGEAKVADFGIAKVAASSDLTATGLVLGTPSYLAPECVTGGTATTASDLYAVGVVLYEALSGSRPFAGETPLALCRAIVSDAPRPLRELRPDVSAAAAAVVTRAMAKDPRDRYPSAGDMMRALDGAALGEPTQPIDTEAAQRIDTQPTVPARSLTTIVLEPTALAPTTLAPTTLAPTTPRERLVPSRVASRGPGGRKRARLVAVLAAGAATVGVGLILGVASHGAGKATTPTVTTPRTTVATSAAAPSSTVAPTTPATQPGKGPGNGPGHGKPKPPKGGGPGPG